MFNEARTKLTLYYLTIIMIISLFFSGIVYKSLTFELNRIENMQRMRRANANFSIDPEIISETKSRILSSLIIINTAILIVSGLSGYFLAGKTLNPIQKMMDEQKEFISDASHELRTPLSSLKSQIEVALRSKKLSLGESRRILESNLEDVNNMTNLSNYLLKLNKEQNGKTLLKKVDLAEIVLETVGKKAVNLNLVKTIISGDRDSLKELVNILVDNAIKYGEGKEISISLKSKTLKVTDHGLGISQKDLPHIFNRFYRSDRARGKDGYGLGLSIAKQIVDNHNAKIKVESKLGIGTTFKVIFS